MGSVYNLSEDVELGVGRPKVLGEAGAALGT
jgi:hypothetical protein